jgi:trans-2-enoyl-CoA reductase
VTSCLAPTIEIVEESMNTKLTAILVLIVLYFSVSISCKNSNKLKEQNVAAHEHYIQIASKLFEKRLKSGRELKSYRIGQVNFIASKIEENNSDRVEHIFGSKTTNDAFIVLVDFSVKPKIKYYGNWIAGNGHSKEGGWIANKSEFVTIDKQNNFYQIISIGTGL